MLTTPNLKILQEQSVCDGSEEMKEDCYPVTFILNQDCFHSQFRKTIIRKMSLK